MLPKLLTSGIFFLAFTFAVQAQTHLYGFSGSGIIQEPNSGGSFWKISADGTAFTTLKAFQTEKLFKPIGDMLIDTVSQIGYGIGQGLDEDQGVLLVYQYDFGMNKPEVLHTIYGRKQASELLLTSGQYLYLCGYADPSGLELYQIAKDGSGAAQTHAFGASYLHFVSIFAQMPDGKILAGIRNKESEFTFSAGNPDGSDWNTLSTQPPSTFGYTTANAVSWPDGSLYGTAYGTNQSVTIFKITPDYAVNLLHQSNAVDFGSHASLHRGADNAVYLIARKGAGIQMYRMPDDNTPPVIFYSTQNHGVLQGHLNRSSNGDLYFLSQTTSQPNQTAYVTRVNFANNSVDVVQNQTYPTPYNSYYFSSPFFHPGTNRVYYWRYFDFTRSLDDVALSSCNVDGALFAVNYTMPPEPSTDGHAPGAAIKGSDQKIYALLTKGGPNQYGTLISMDTTGENFSVLYHFQPPATMPAWSRDRIYHLFEGSDGLLYGSLGDGIFFGIQKNGAGYTAIKSDLEPGVMVTEFPDGRFYFGGAKVKGMNKDGSNVLTYNSSFIQPFVPDTDFCRLIKLSNNDIGAVGSTSYVVGSDFYTDGLLLYQKWPTGAFHKKTNVYVRNHFAAAGINNWLHFGRGYYDGDDNSILSVETLCVDETQNLNVFNVEDVFFTLPNGRVAGKRNQATDFGPTWMPIIWGGETGNCIMSRNWELEMGHYGQLAFPGYTPGTSVHQPEWAEHLLIYPNPTMDGCSITCSIQTADHWNIAVTDVAGRRLWQTAVQVQAGDNQVKIPAEAFPEAGCFLISVQSAQGQLHRKVIAH